MTNTENGELVVSLRKPTNDQIVGAITHTPFPLRLNFVTFSPAKLMGLNFIDSAEGERCRAITCKEMGFVPSARFEFESSIASEVFAPKGIMWPTVRRKYSADADREMIQIGTDALIAGGKPESIVFANRSYGSQGQIQKFVDSFVPKLEAAGYGFYSFSFAFPDRLWLANPGVPRPPESQEPEFTFVTERKAELRYYCREGLSLHLDSKNRWKDSQVVSRLEEDIDMGDEHRALVNWFGEI